MKAYSILSFALPLALFAVPFLTACGNKDGGSPAAVETVAIAATPELSKMRHRPSECPKNLEGAWTSTTIEGVEHDVIYTFEGRKLIENRTENRYILDGEIQRLPDQDGMGFWYVGACKAGKIQFKMWATNGDKVVKIDGTTILRRGRLALAQEMNGIKVPFVTVYERKFDHSRRRH